VPIWSGKGEEWNGWLEFEGKGFNDVIEIEFISYFKINFGLQSVFFTSIPVVL